VIRVVTLEEFDPKQVAKFCQLLYQAFGVGSEHIESRASDALGDPFDAASLLERPPRVRAFADDKVLFLTRRRLKDRELPTGKAPTQGWAKQGQVHAVLSTHPKKDLEEGMKLVGRHALHQLGHLWDVHHCLDPRCAMYPPWTPSFAAGDAAFCSFCRDKSEQKIRLAKS
jgi:archaemetzincin